MMIGNAADLHRAALHLAQRRRPQPVAARRRRRQLPEDGLRRQRRLDDRPHVHLPQHALPVGRVAAPRAAWAATASSSTPSRGTTSSTCARQRTAAPASNKQNIDNDFDYDLYNGRVPPQEAHGVRGEPVYAAGAGFDPATQTGRFPTRAGQSRRGRGPADSQLQPRLYRPGARPRRPSARGASDPIWRACQPTLKTGETTMQKLTRRRFVKGCLAAGMAFELPGAAPSAGSNSEVRLAIVGLGGIDVPGGVGGRGAAHRRISQSVRHRMWSACAMWARAFSIWHPGNSSASKSGGHEGHAHRYPARARRQERGRGGRGHAQPLARTGRRLGVSGGQGCVTSRAARVQHIGKGGRSSRRRRSTADGTVGTQSRSSSALREAGEFVPQRADRQAPGTPMPSSTGRGRAWARSRRRRRFHPP